MLSLLLGLAALRPAVGGVDPIATNQPQNLMAFPTGTVAELRPRLTGGAARTLRWQLERWEGGVVRSGSVPAEGALVRFETRGLPLGPYPLRLTWLDADGREVQVRECRVGVISRAVLPKARPGEFRFGLDVQFGDPAADSPLWRWKELMGVDVVRGGVGWTADPPYVTARMPLYRAAGILPVIMVDPPKNPNPEERARELADLCRRIAEIARTHPELKFWEMGNEPDLRGFYGLDMQSYADSFVAMRAAVKRHIPDAVVMNGGLSFAGAEGRERSRELVRRMPKGQIDAWAYHGHGPLVDAERNAYRLMESTAREFGWRNLPFIQTESGVAARTGPLELMQARTCVQKMTFAQSVGMPFFLWFRLLMFEEDYGNLHNPAGTEPRPAVLAYRNMVEQLRGRRFVKRLDFGRDDVEGYAFARPGGRERVVVLWANLPAPVSVDLAVGAGTRVRRVDLFGNASTVPVSAAGQIRVPAGPDPLYLVWTSARAGDPVVVPPPLLAAEPTIQLVEGGAARLIATVSNPGRTPATAVVSLSLGDGVPSMIEPKQARVTLRPGERRPLEFRVTPSTVRDPFTWPAAWRLYLDVDAGRLNLADLSRWDTPIPSALPGIAGDVQPVTVAPDSDGRVDLVALGGAIAERRAAVLVAEMESEADLPVPVGGGSDFWMQWWLNGKVAFSTLETGNGPGFSAHDHLFSLPLRRGRNRLVVLQLSGSLGRQIYLGDPRLTRAFQGKRTGAMVATWRVSVGSLPERTETSAIRLDPRLPGLEAGDTVADWLRRTPTAGWEDGSSVENRFVKEPDSSRWWKGPADLSAVWWLRQSADALEVRVRVRDDRPVAGGDGVTVRWESEAGDRRGSVESITPELADASAFYRLRIPRAELGSGLVRLSLEVRDDDGFGPKQTLRSAPVRVGW